MDTRDSNDHTLGPKRKTHVEDMHEDTSIEKKQKLLDMEAKTLVHSWQTIWDRQWLLGSIAGHNKHPKLELSGAWNLQTVNALKRA